jgi:hypothetical protein
VGSLRAHKVTAVTRQRKRVLQQSLDFLPLHERSAPTGRVSFAATLWFPVFCLLHMDDSGNRGHTNRRASDNEEPLTVTIEPSRQKYSYEAKQYRLDRARYRLEKKAYCTAHWTMVFLIIYTGLTLIVAVMSIISGFAAKKSADTATNQLELTLRPWVFVKDAKVVSPLTFDKEWAHVTFEITLHNSGLTPAVNAVISPKLYPLPLIETAKRPIERLCDATSYANSSTGLLLFPNTDSPPQTLTFGMSKGEIADNTHDGVLVITPLICVLYRPTFRKDGAGYSSGIQYALWPTIWPDKTTSLPANQLPLVRNGFFGEDAQ